MHTVISIPAPFYSEAIWKTIRYRVGDPTSYIPPVDVLKSPATVSQSTAEMLWRLGRFFKPKVVAEVGTYIGRSARAIAHGMESGEIFTCDSETNHPIAMTAENVKLYRHNTTSTEMLSQMTKPVDFWFFDGRVQPDDIPHIQRLSSPDCVIALDDFIGVEKGVANALMLQHLGGILVYPEEGQTLAMMVRKVGFVRQ